MRSNRAGEEPHPNEFEGYRQAAKDWILPGTDREEPWPYTGKGYAACRANGEVTYHPARPWAVETPYVDDNVDLILADYTDNPEFGSGAGFWAISAREMAKVIRQLTFPGPRWPTATEKAKIRSRELGWFKLPRGGFRFAADAPPSPYDPQTSAMCHNGIFGSTGAIIAHLFKGPKTVDVMASFNTGGITDLGDGLPNILLNAVQEAETLRLWSPVDLLEDIELEP